MPARRPDQPPLRPRPSFHTAGVSVLAGVAGLLFIAAADARFCLAGSKPGPAAASPPKPVFAVQLNYTPSAAPAVALQYISGTDAYVSTPQHFYTRAELDRWQTSTFHLAHVLFSGRENAGADFRIVAPAGISVRKVTIIAETVSRHALRHSGPPAEWSFNPRSVERKPVISGKGLEQVAAGGDTIDSRYRPVVIGGSRAELLTHPAVDYLYFRLSRRSRLFAMHPHRVAIRITWTSTKPPRVWTSRTFFHLRAEGITRAEINLEWGLIEPRTGRFDFRILDRTLRHAAQAGVKVIPIFWYSVWHGNPPSWIGRYDIGSAGTISRVPVWWSQHYRQAYFHYVLKSIRHLRHESGFGGAFLDFGWLDYMWGPPPGPGQVNGYAPQDVNEFHRWLQARYHSAARLDRRFNTHFAHLSLVSAEPPGQPLFPLYQRFRNWSVMETYGRLTAAVRRLTHAPLYYYWGGGFSGAGVAFNIPDTFFRLARRYQVIVCEDCADRTGLMLLFSSLAAAYRVPLFEEWTPHARLKNEMAQFLGHYGLESRQAAGMDFFLYHGGREFNIGFPPYRRALPLLARLHGRYPRRPVAIYISYRPVFMHPAILQGFSSRLAAIWRTWHIPFTVVTDREIRAGVIRLSRFKAVYPMDGANDPFMAAYKRHGGHVVHHPAQLLRYIHPFLTLTPAFNGLEAVPMVSSGRDTIRLSLALWWRSPAFRGKLILHPTALGVRSGRYQIINLADGRRIAARRRGSSLTVRFHIKPGQLRLWKLVRAPIHRAAALSGAAGRSS